MTSHSKRGFVTRECTNIATRTSTTAAASHRPGWRTGTALISSGGPVRSGGLRRARCRHSVLRLRLIGRPILAGGQLVAPLMAGLEMAPACTPHLSRIFMYVPSAMRCFRAASTGLAIPLFFGIAIPYGAVP